MSAKEDKVELEGELPSRSETECFGFNSITATRRPGTSPEDAAVSHPYLTRRSGKG